MIMEYFKQKMMKIIKILAAMVCIPLLIACDADHPFEMDETVEYTPIRVKAFLPGEIQSRAQITYGGCYDTDGKPNPKIGETFMWNDKDWFTLFNITRLNECPEGAELEAIKISEDRKTAIFETVSSVKPNLSIRKGDTIFVMSGQVLRYYKKDSYGQAILDEVGKEIFDERKIFTIPIGAEANKPQPVLINPNDESLSFMKENLIWYDIVTVEDDGIVPDLHFKHLSAIMRITVHNESGKDLYPTKLELLYNTNSQQSNSEDGIDRNPSFFKTAMYCSIIGSASGGIGFKLYDTNDIYRGSQPYTYSIGTTINSKDGTNDTGESIRNGETYEFYITAVPRIDNDSKGEAITISLTVFHDTDHQYSLTLHDFYQVINAGKRYWFNVTATPAGDLVLTSQFDPTKYPNSTTE